jgi:16S rRNA (guanine966-N2)-methyltransferase
MRIVGGRLKGRALVSPSGRTTRPTSDRARESIFNILAHAPWATPLAGARVIDLFAGSGALGFEALSQGASFCLFVEIDDAARGAIRTNIDAFQLFGATRVHRRSALDLGRKPASVGAPFTHVFIDPPYGSGHIPATLSGLVDGHWLAQDALAIVETAEDEPVSVDGWDVLDTRTIGAAWLTFLSQTPVP